MRRLTVAAGFTVVLLAGSVVPAGAGGAGGAYTEIVINPGPSAGAYTDTAGTGASAANDDEAKPRNASGRRRSSRRPSKCTYELLAQGDQATAERFWGPSPGGPGSWARKICLDEFGRSTATIVWVPRRVNPATMAERAERYLPLPAPSVSTSPPPDRLLVVGLATWLWVDPSTWRPLSSTASVAGVSVTVTAVPERVTWQMGDGTTLVCRGPGRPYNPALSDEQQSTDCSHIYRHTSAGEPDQTFEIIATTEWHVTWTVSGAAGGGDLGVVRRTSPPLPVRVGEVQAVNVRPNAGR
jgi:hypothetical protein